MAAGRTTGAPALLAVARLDERRGGIAITAGVLAGSIALISFGLDSVIEGFASLVIVWRFTGRRLLSHAAEERAQKLVALQFFVLAPYVAFEAIHKLITAERPGTSVLGIALVTSSLVGMPILGIAKRRLADTLGSVATRGEGMQNLLCAYLAGAVLVGLLGNALFGLFGGSIRRRRSSSPGWPSERTSELARRGLLRGLLTRSPLFG